MMYVNEGMDILVIFYEFILTTNELKWTLSHTFAHVIQIIDLFHPFPISLTFGRHSGYITINGRLQIRRALRAKQTGSRVFYFPIAPSQTQSGRRAR